MVDKYLDCGNPKCGFARTKCSDCWTEKLLMFSCKTRGFCPSCHAKRLEELGKWMILSFLRTSCWQFMFVLCIIVNEAAQRVKTWWNWEQIVMNKKRNSYLSWGLRYSEKAVGQSPGGIWPALEQDHSCIGQDFASGWSWCDYHKSKMKGLFPDISMFHSHCGLLGRTFLWFWSTFAIIHYSKPRNNQDLLRAKNSLRYFLIKIKKEK